MGDTAAASASVEKTTITVASTTFYYTDAKGVTTSSLVISTPTAIVVTTVSKNKPTQGSVATTPSAAAAGTVSSPSTSSPSTSSPSTSSPSVSSPITTSGSSSSTTVVAGPGSSTTLPPTPTPTAAPAGSGLGKGAVAGVAVACIIGGALIAALLTWFIMNGRQKKRHRSSGGGFGSERHRSRPSNEKALPSAPLLGGGGGVGGGVVGNWEKHLDQPESDNTIMRSVKGLFDHIEVHVENFYRDAAVTMTPELQNALMAVEGSRELPDSVAGLLPLTERPTLLIKHCIAHAIVEHISFEAADVPDSFLPTDFVALPQALNTRRTTANKPAYNQAYARWRVLSAYLRPKPAEDPAYTRTRDGHVAALADKLCRTFEPWALSRDNFASRRENLINIMKGAAETGVLLFSQPSTFQWIWRKGSGAGKAGRLAVVLLPGLEKVRDEEARALERGVLVLRPVEGVLVG